jgi:cell division protein FtsQ
VLLALAAVVLVALGVWLVFFSSVLAVTGVEVRGTDVLSAKQVEAVAKVPHDVPLATVDLSAIKARVEDLAPVRSAEVSRSWPHSVLITVDERQPVAFVVRDGRYQGVDPSGVLFRDYPQRPTDLPEIQMQPTTPVDALSEGAAVVAAMPAELVQRVAYVDVRSIDNITLHLKRGATVTWGSADQSTDKAQVLSVLLAQKARAYDVTAPGHPTIRR